MGISSERTIDRSLLEKQVPWRLGRALTFKDFVNNTQAPYRKMASESYGAEIDSRKYAELAMTGEGFAQYKDSEKWQKIALSYMGDHDFVHLLNAFLGEKFESAEF